MKKSVAHLLDLEKWMLNRVEKELARPVLREAFLSVDSSGAMLLDGEPAYSDEIDLFEYQIDPSHDDDWSVGSLVYEKDGSIFISDFFCDGVRFRLTEYPYKIAWRGVYPQE